MAITFLIDENLRGPLWRAIQRHNAIGGLIIDAVRVGDPVDLPLGTLDPTILDWIEREDRILLTFDRVSMPAHLAAHLQDGKQSPGIFVIDQTCSLQTVVEYLELVAHAGDPVEFRDQVW